MKILHVITTLFTGGAERLIVDLMPRFMAAGHTVEVLVFYPKETPFAQKLRDSGITIHYLNCKKVYSPLNVFRLKKYLDGYDIIHTHNTACQYYVALAARIFGTKARLFTTEHNTTNRRRNMPLMKYVDRGMYRMYEHIISVSDATTANLREHIGINAKITTINNGINLSRFDMAQNRDPKIVQLVMIAAFRPQKDQDTVVRAMKLLPKNVRLILVGEGNRRPLVMKLAQDIHVEDRVVFTGVATNISEILLSSNIVVLSSHWEGFGLAAVEGLAAGCPIVASNVEGLRDIVGDAGLFFTPGNEKALAEDIMRLIEDAALYDDLATKALSRAKIFDIDNTSKRYLALYEA